ncbi:MAG: diguanylate cyclase [Kiritimatiellia bacterium]|nr:diguanylate cyclase [Kiritimatiellia bacterium]MDP6630320.1 diguanylate cyclase [Kiritimatiellia bacterium]MDP6810827.1 diguanylate cyclase [Kiritimatiellia bacterium]MDP7024169.1 diguanylate cyclase [Kiritimatiellia bacterium]
MPSIIGFSFRRLPVYRYFLLTPSLNNDGPGAASRLRVRVEKGTQQAAVLGRAFRQGVDWIARYGGEEFIVILPEADAGVAHHVAERLRAELEDAGPVALGTDVRVTASFGVAGIT